MDEYISREKIAAEVRELSTHLLNEWDTMGVLALIDRQPAADVAPVIHAHWREDGRKRVREMRKAVLMSIRPKWCALIASGKKTIEVRKTRPHAILPLKVYIYQTKGKTEDPFVTSDFGETFHVLVSGTVVGEFVVHNIFPISVEYSDPNCSLANREFPGTGLTDREIIDYLGNGKTGYGWLISDLVIYDYPKNLREFSAWEYNANCGSHKQLLAPPQSFCYVEELT